jgi:4-hydroxy-4-methyl-2-oxoglutarate aldolase
LTLTSRLFGLYASAVHDVLRGMGHDNVVLPTDIRPLDPTRKLAGPVWTCSGHLDHTTSRHETLLGWTTLLSKAPAGHVVVCQPHNRSVAMMGELSAETLKNKGVLGYVVDGGCRDADFILDLGFPVFHAFFTPSDIVSRWVPDVERFGQPIVIGGVTIRSGDWIIGDRDGIVVIPQAIAEEVVSKTEDVARTENLVRDAIRGGMDPVQAYLEHGKF